MTDEEHFAEWQRYIKATYRETVDAFWNRKLYRAVRQMFRTNPDLAASGQHIWEWIAGTGWWLALPGGTLTRDGCKPQWIGDQGMSRALLRIGAAAAVEDCLTAASMSTVCS